MKDENFMNQNWLALLFLWTSQKAFDCIPHDRSITKLEAYGISYEELAFVYISIFTVKNNPFKSIILGVPFYI